MNYSSLTDYRKVLPSKKFLILQTWIQRSTKSGYDVDLKPTSNKSEKRKRQKWNIIWFNPSFGKYVSTNVPKIFSQLETKHFREATNFTKFSTAIQLKSATVARAICEKSSSDIIKKSHRNHATEHQVYLQKNGKCPMEVNCQVNDVVYKCDVTRSLSKKVCLRLQEEEWKSRFSKHKLSFKHKRHFNKTTLSS